MTYIGLKEFDKAIAEFKKARALDPEGYRGLSSLAYAEGISGNRSEALRIEKELLEQSKTKYVSSYALAVVKLGLGENVQAMKYLEEAYIERCPMMPFIGMNPIFNSLKNNSQFQTLVQKIEMLK